MPYIYSLAWKTTNERTRRCGRWRWTIVTDTRALNIGDQFMFGPALLVNPVTEPGATTRRMYLPKASGMTSGRGSAAGGAMIERRRRSIGCRCLSGQVDRADGAGRGVCEGEASRPDRIARLSRTNGTFAYTKTRTTTTTTKKECTRRFDLIRMMQRGNRRSASERGNFRDAGTAHFSYRFGGENTFRDRALATG